MSNTFILSIETSCDETAVAILRYSGKNLTVLSNQISSQIKLHAKWGGVVPNLAAREHLKNFPNLLKIALSEANVTPDTIDLITITHGPGLIPALLVGVNYAKILSYLWEKPLLGIHHIEGHIYANFIGNTKKIDFPVLALIVSGGHTQLVLMRNHLQYEVIGQTLDDAVGEAFDKVARILGIGYPGGPIVSTLADEYQISKDTYHITFPRPMINKKNFDFSFSGLKTAVLYETKKNPKLMKNKDYIIEICHEFQQACIDVLCAKTLSAAKDLCPKTILLAGGVSANSQLRKQLGASIKQSLPDVNYITPELALTGDNAAMIAAAAAFRWDTLSEQEKKALTANWKKIQPDANLKLK
jgi:N6-L-threonylcarbamoyladenine synthase